MSEIRDIFTALAAKTIQVESSKAYGTVTPQIFDLHQLPASAESAKLPARWLLPFGVFPTEAREYHFVALGSTTKVTWQISDLLLWRSVELGLGLSSDAVDLVNYAGLYADMLRTFRRPVANSQTYIESVNLAIGIYEYPAQSGHFFYGCSCVFHIPEVLSG
jgi:hypothetical protein